MKKEALNPILEDGQRQKWKEK